MKLMKHGGLIIIAIKDEMVKVIYIMRVFLYFLPDDVVKEKTEYNESKKIRKV